MSVLAPEVAAFLDAQVVGVLGTTATNGRPRQSVVYFARDGERLLVSTEATRLKALDVERTGWASLCVMGTERPFPSATLTGPARVLTQDIGPATAAIMPMPMLAPLPLGGCAPPSGFQRGSPPPPPP